MGTIKDYRKMVEQPWGRMFYEMIYNQLDFSGDKRLRILDFGAGFCITADHYAKDHEVIAVEPNEEMYSLRVKENEYTLIKQGLDYLKTVPDNSIDVALCHNVLEYVDNREEILKQLARVVKPEGVLSVIKHNLYGRVMGSAVLADDPQAALDLLNEVPEDSMFRNRSVYSDELLSNLGDNAEEAIETTTFRKAQTNGTVAHITAIFGFTLAGLVIKDITAALR